MIFSAQMHYKGFKFVWDTINNKTFPLNSAYLQHLSVQLPTSLPSSCNLIAIQFAIQFAINEELKDLTHMFYL
jgi:hypothetical protein